MATTQLVVSALYSGQGMCNVVESYDGATVTKLMLVDFGAEKDSKRARAFTLQTLKAKIEAYGKIDVMVISHSDKDHWNLMGELLKILDPKVKIHLAAFGLGVWIAGALEFKQAVGARVPTKAGLKIFDAGTSDIHVGGATIDRWDLGWDGVTFNVLAASAQIWNVDSSYAKVFSESNTASIVLRVKFADKYSVLTGDATGVTLKFINGRLDGHSLSGDCLMMTAPHHGALATLYGTLGDLATFVDATKPQCALASAQMRGGYNHPAVCVMATMLQATGKGAFGDHSMVLSFKEPGLCVDNAIYKALNKLPATVSRPNEQWYTISSTYNIFTTLKTGTEAVNWNFNTAANGATSVTASALLFDFARGEIRPNRPEGTDRARDPDDFYVGDPPPAAFLADLAPPEIWQWPSENPQPGRPPARDVGDDIDTAGNGGGDVA